MHPSRIAAAITGGSVGEVIVFSFFLCWSLSKALESTTEGYAPLSERLLIAVAIGIGTVVAIAFLRTIHHAQLQKLATPATVAERLTRIIGHEVFGLKDYGRKI